MTLNELKARLATRAKAFASDPQLVTDMVLTLAANEALELAGVASPLPVIVDIAFYRLLLQIGNHIDEVEQQAYRTALSQVTDPDAAAAATSATSKHRANPYR